MPKPGCEDINFFRPRGKNMRCETRVIMLVLLGWLLAIVGSQGLAYLLVRSGHKGILSQWTFFNLPIPFWLTGQFLPLWFIILCVAFNIWMDRHAAREPDGTLRFRVRGGQKKGDE